MTPHDHDTFQDWCYRCELSRDEAADYPEMTEEEHEVFKRQWDIDAAKGHENDPRR